MSTPVRTRFAPSPTGYMHIGGMRTALFNWLWARHNGGTFVLRIDDTDQQRNLDEAVAPILHAFRWLGLHWDEGPDVGGDYGPYFQSQRGDRYQAALEKLMAAGKAYKDFDSPEVVKADREAAEKEKRNYLNIRRSLDLSPQEIADLEEANTSYVIRFLVDRTRKVAIQDSVRGDVEWDCALISDPVIMRSNGSPLYNFASVVDDIDMQITHVIRAEEHLANTSVQALIFEALSGSTPQFAHIPFVAAPGTTKKLSKRDVGKYRNNPQFRKLFALGDTAFPILGNEVSESLNPVMVSYYEQLGFLPEAILNSLARLGWSLDDVTENMSLDFIVEHFTLDRVVKASAGFDPDRLLAFQEHWMESVDTAARVEQCLPYLIKAGWISSSPTDDERAFTGRLITALGERLKVFSDILNYDEYFVADDQLVYDEKAYAKRVEKSVETTIPLLQGYRDVLAAEEDFTASALEAALNQYVESRGAGLGDIIHALRLATTGKPAGPGMFDCLELLGKERCLARIDRMIAHATS
ncbi:MAG: glutamate--tRNA ligase [Planctomycetaceae bacterium]|nr:glutamate--tRNA ligase [Planctomycetaceae bacterium]MCB9950686.1 glutamate--tRNA ligase [Planctomycetaceae bacterium]